MNKFPKSSIFVLIMLLLAGAAGLSTQIANIFDIQQISEDKPVDILQEIQDIPQDETAPIQFITQVISTPADYYEAQPEFLSSFGATPQPATEPQPVIPQRETFKTPDFSRRPPLKQDEEMPEEEPETPQSISQTLPPEQLSAASIPAASNGPPADGTYKIAAGDTLGSLAIRFETTVAHLSYLNNITNPDSIRIGQTLSVPNSSNPAPSPTPAPAAEASPAPEETPVPASPDVSTPEPETYTDTQMLARMIHHEAHWEEYGGKIAVGQCAYDRWQNTSRATGQSSAWNAGAAKSLQEVITAPSQFGLSDMDKVCDNCLKAASDVLGGTKAFPNHIVTNFRPTASTEEWNGIPYIGHIGGHAFYGYPR